MGNLTKRRKLVSGYWRNQSGQFSIIFAITVTAIILAVAVGVEISEMVRKRSQLQDAIDSAALAAVKRASDVYKDDGDIARAIAAGEAIATEYYEINSFLSPEEAQRLQTRVRFDDDRIIADSDWSGNFNTVLMGAFGVNTLPLNLKARAQDDFSTFEEIHFVIDNSMSMGVGSSRQAIQRMANEFNCAFACHAPDAIDTWSNTLTIANNIGAELRIDTIRNNLTDLMDGFIASPFQGNLAIGVHTYSNTLDTLTRPSTNLRNVRRDVRNVNLTGDLFEGGTNHAVMLSDITNVIGRSGTGQSANDPVKTIVLVTDGTATNVRLEDKPTPDRDSGPDPRFVPFGGPTPQWDYQGFDASLCTRLKDNDVRVIVLLTEYLIPTVGTDDDNRFNDIENRLKPQIEDNMRACASSPQDLYVAGFDNEIGRAFEDLARNLREANLRLSN